MSTHWRDFIDCPRRSKDALELFIGRFISAGTYRTVYEFTFDPAYVVKLENEIYPNRRFCNVNEYDVWCEVRELEHRCHALAKWLAPIKFISPQGSVLIQKRTTPVTLQELKRAYPKVPEFFADLKDSNWGRLDGKIVCHDYANACVDRGYSLKMKKADWY